MERFEYKDRDGDYVYIEVDEDGELVIGIVPRLDPERFIYVDPLDAPRIARALLERAGHKVGGKTFADAAVGALKDHEEVVSGQKELDEKVKKYFKEVRQQTLTTVLDWHREEFRRAEKFNEEVFGRRPRIVRYDNAVTVDKSAKWKTQALNHMTFTFKHENGNWYSQTNRDAKDQWRIYGQSLLTLGASYFPLEEVLD